MAEAKATLILQLKDFASQGVKSFVDVMALGKMALVGFQQTFGRMVEFLSSSLDSFSEADKAVNRLNTALKNQGFYTSSYSKALVDNATALQAVTTFGDEAILETQTMLTTFGLAGAKLRETTKATLDLSQAMGIDLKSATLLMGKAFAGETSSLSRYGIMIGEGGTATEKFDQALAKVQSRFGGAAADAVGTYAGQVLQLTNKFDDLKELIGKELLPVAKYWVENLMKMARWTEKALESEDRLTNSSDKIIVSIRQRIEILKQEMQIAAGSLEDQIKRKAVLDSTIAVYVKLTDAAKKAGNARQEAEKEPESKGPVEVEIGNKTEDTHAGEIAKKLALDEEYAIESGAISADQDLSRLEAMGLLAEAKATLKAEEMAAELQAVGQHENAKLLLERNSALNSVAIQKMRSAATMQMLGMVATLSNAKNKEIAVVGKAAAIAMTLINAHVAAGKAMAAFAAIPPLAIAMGGIMEAAGLAQAAQIAGVPLAEGGMVLPRSGGVPAIMAEAGKSEVAIPLDDERTKEKLRDTLGGGGNSVIVQVGTLVATRESMTELASIIDEELFRLEKNRRSVRG
jgi:hypothetical protein